MGNISYTKTEIQITVTGIRIFRHSHNELIPLLRLIQTYAYSDLYLSHYDLILTQELHLWQTYPYLDLKLIALILIRVLYLEQSPVGVTKPMLVLRILYLYYRAYPCLTDILLVLHSLFWYFESYPGITEHTHVFWILYMYYRTYTCILDLIHIFQILFMSYRVSTGLTELILVLRNLYWSYGTYTCHTFIIISSISSIFFQQIYI